MNNSLSQTCPVPPTADFFFNIYYIPHDILYFWTLHFLIKNNAFAGRKNRQTYGTDQRYLIINYRRIYTTLPLFSGHDSIKEIA